MTRKSRSYYFLSSTKSIYPERLSTLRLDFVVGRQ